MTRGSRIEEREGAAGGENGLGCLGYSPRCRMPTRDGVGERVGCGCFLIAIGSVVAFLGLIWASIDGFYGESGI